MKERVKIKLTHARARGWACARQHVPTHRAPTVRDRLARHEPTHEALARKVEGAHHDVDPRVIVLEIQKKRQFYS